MDLIEVLQIIALSLGLGLLVGLQREHAESQVAGIRTFALITLAGTLTGLLALVYGGWTVAAGLLGVVVLLVIANVAKMRGGANEPGLTTEVAAVVMYALGAYLVIGHTEIAVVIAGVVAILLHFKGPLHTFVHRMGERDFMATMQFVLIALVIFPVLPDENYGPFGVFNPREIWLMVVLITGLSLVGYVVYKLFGQNVGTVMGGLLGGLISSTATTVSYARRAGANHSAATQAALVIMIASAVAVGRVIVEVAAVAPSILWRVAPPLLTMLVWMALVSFGMYWFGRGEKTELPDPENPAELKAALTFAALYAIIKLAVAATQHYYGDAGLYAVATISGLTDMDAITLSTANLVEGEQLSPHIGWQVIVIAILANLVFKGATAAVLGHRRLAGLIAVLFGLSIAGGLAILFLWPGELMEQWIELWIESLEFNDSGNGATP